MSITPSQANEHFALHRLWQQLEKALLKQRLSHALLLVGPLCAELDGMSMQLAKALLCQTALSLLPCLQCKSCSLISMNQHPDFIDISPEKSGSPIKIDQIRGLPERLFTAPQLGKKRVVLIHSAERMNISASNALLKILEEPPLNTHFVLTAEQISTVSPTLLSRCQHWHSELVAEDYLSHGQSYSREHERGKMFNQRDILIDDLCQLQEARISVNSLALKWSTFDFKALLWLLYLLTSALIGSYYGIGSSNELSTKLAYLAKELQPVHLFRQLDKLNEIIKNLNHTLSMNQLLVLEELLMGYKKGNGNG